MIAMGSLGIEDAGNDCIHPIIFGQYNWILVATISLSLVWMQTCVGFPRVRQYRSSVYDGNIYGYLWNGYGDGYGMEWNGME